MAVRIITSAIAKKFRDNVGALPGGRVPFNGIWISHELTGRKNFRRTCGLRRARRLHLTGTAWECEKRKESKSEKNCCVCFHKSSCNKRSVNGQILSSGRNTHFFAIMGRSGS